MSTVALCDARKGITRAVASALDEIGWPALVDRGAPTLYKVNLTHDLLLPGAIVSPAVVHAAHRHMASYLGPVVIGETSQVVTDADKAYRASGFDRLCTHLGLQWCNMTHHEWIDVTAHGETLKLPVITQTHQVVNLCVMKTHFRSTISGALKNFWGFLEGGRERFHPELPTRIAQLHTLIPCRLHIMDAVVAMEGNGPKSGRPKEVGLVLASADPVALDATAARLMGFDPATIEHIQVCAQRGLGSADPARIHLVGDAADALAMRFAPARQNFIARVEARVRQLRGGGGGGLHGRPLEILAWGARQWYRFAYEAFGTRRRVERFLRSTEFDGEWRRR
ncbi:DUF362 domain-containing protein [Candidatus Fermentibacteria bacterium]|nr:DUF362 domain-containing protein [Candidatus Fermentibacteria bacterium]